MLKKVAFLSLPLLLLAQNGLISKLKEQEIELDKKKSIVEAKILHDSWINPINMRYTYQKGDQYPNQLFKSFSIQVDQPIFKSGGIYKAILYANAKKRSALFGVQSKEKSYVFRYIRLALQYKQLQLSIKKQKLLIENAKLDILIKKDQYLHGEIDSTFLDNAILNKNRLAIALIDLEDKLQQTKKEIKNISDLDPDSAQIPRFTLIQRAEFLQKNLSLKQSQADIEANKNYAYMSIARYLPSLSLFANYNSQKMQGSLYVPGYKYSDSYKTYGFRISMPLFDINALRNIESAKIDYLKSKNHLLQLMREKRNFYKTSLHSLKLLDKKIALTKEDLGLYEGLLKDTKDRFEAGEKTKYDVQIMQNSLKTKELDLKIFDMQKQIILSQLYQEMSDEKI
ncbi:TolC family protein [Nitratiruptor tergarcus]|uniref:Outer membrane protein n=1 Tax=Nitratiruptor tergarcus DSM 16512 TaxID=1069081 RepID=A0A1W1WUG9_9BACT|nr:TolC family protein [Nitratiruptor tergarcus]SMC09845.1 Outer membrane protein [Nitratiruptor tergarcus DSM 16512]